MADSRPLPPAEDPSRDHLLAGAPRDAEGHPVLGGIPLLRKLGQGGMGAVYRAFHPRLGVEVAVKVLTFHLVTGDAAAVGRFTEEARLAARLESPHLVRVLDIDEQDGIHFLVMEYVAGVSAGSLLRARAEQGQGGLEEAVALQLVRAASAGLAEAHRHGVVHRDVKPDNILVPRRPGRDELEPAAAKLADLGLAKLEGQGGGATATGLALGTPGYMAPEQVRDGKRAGPASDVFGMGATLFALLAGRPPFLGSSATDVLFRTVEGRRPALAEVCPGLAAGTLALVERCLQADPRQRPPDAAALLADLDRLRPGIDPAGRPSAAPPPRAPDPGAATRVAPTPAAPTVVATAVASAVPSAAPSGDPPASRLPGPLTLASLALVGLLAWSLVPGDPAPGGADRATDLLRAGRPGEAETLLRAEVTARPGDLAPHMRLGLALEHQGRLAEAEAEYREGVRTSPRSGWAHGSLGLLLQRAGQPAEAERELRTAVQVEPGNQLAAQALKSFLAGRPPGR